MVQSSKPILVVQTAFLGDLLLGIPLFKKIRKLHPQSPIYLVCREGLGSLFKSLKIVDEAFEVKKGSSASYLHLLAQLRKTDFEQIICPHQSVRSAIFVWLLKSKSKIGFSQFWNFLIFNRRVRRNLQLPDALRQMSLVEPVKIESKVTDDQSMDISRNVSASYPSTVPYVCIFPGSVWPTKRWTESGFVQVARQLQGYGFRVLLMGDAREKILCEQIQNQVPGVESLAGSTSVLDTLGVLKGATLVISNDSAGQHLASAVAAPVISIFGPTVTGFGYTPWQNKFHIVEKQGLTCRPCGKHGAQKCPIGTHECMKSISADDVLKACQHFLPIK